MADTLIHTDLERSLGRVEGKLDLIIDRLDKMNGTLGRHDQEINSIKTRVAIIVVSLSAAINIAWEFLKNRLKNL